MRLWLQLGEGNSWEGGGVGDAAVGYVDSPRSQVVALLLAHSSPPLLLFLLASPCSLLPYSNPFPCGNVPMSWPHSTLAGKGRSPALGPTSQPLPTPPRRAGHPPTQLMPPSTSPPGPSPGQSLRSGPRCFIRGIHIRRIVGNDGNIIGTKQAIANIPRTIIAFC